MSEDLADVRAIVFKGRIDASLLRECVEAVLAVVDEARLKIGESAWKVRAVDPANVALVDLELKRDAFGEFSLGPEKEQGEEREFVVGVPFDKLREVLRWCGDEVALSIEEDKMTVETSAYTFTLNLLSADAVRKEPKMPELNFSTKVAMDAAEFNKVLKAAEKISDMVAIGVQNESFFVEAEGDMETMRYSLHKDELGHLSGGDCRSLFSLEYLAAMAKGFASDTLTLFIGTDYPLKMEFEIADGNGRVVYMLAPRIEAE